MHIDRDNDRDDDIDRDDDVVGERGQPRMKVVLAQQIQREENEGDRNQSRRQQQRTADARPIVEEEMGEEVERDGVIKDIDRAPRPGRNVAGHVGLTVW